jgi:hypothetical protein
MSCPDCDSPDRRHFLRTTALGAASAVIPAAFAKKVPQAASEALVTTLYKSLSAEQKSKVCFPFADPLRSKVDANWHIVPQRIGQFFNPDQQAMIGEIFRNLHNPDFVDKVLLHINDDGKGLANYSAALFGEPATGAFEFVLTGRHCTARCDGDSVAGAAFGGPIFYGHQAGGKFQENADHPNNVYWYQAKRANEVFQALSGKQREEALLGDPRAEKQNETVALKSKSELAGLPVSSMARDQKRLVENVLADLLLPFRKKDVDEAMRYIKGAGGVDALHMSFYKNLDIGNDGIWDVWQLESPNMVWYFRGFPHVHTWVNIRAKA